MGRQIGCRSKLTFAGLRRGRSTGFAGDNTAKRGKPGLLVACVLGLLIAASPLCWGQTLSINQSSEAFPVAILETGGHWTFDWPAVEKCAKPVDRPLPKSPEFGQPLDEFGRHLEEARIWMIERSTDLICGAAWAAYQEGLHARQPQDGSE